MMNMDREGRSVTATVTEQPDRIADRMSAAKGELQRLQVEVDKANAAQQVAAANLTALKQQLVGLTE